LADTNKISSGTKATLLATVDVQNIEDFNKLYSFFDPDDPDSS
jgi:hypothetical protein